MSTSTEADKVRRSTLILVDERVNGAITPTDQDRTDQIRYRSNCTDQTVPIQSYRSNRTDQVVFIASYQSNRTD